MSGFFQGGFAEGAAQSDEIGLAKRELGLAEQRQQSIELKDLSEQVNKQVGATLDTLGSLVKNFDIKIEATEDPAARERLLSQRQDAIQRFGRQAIAIAEKGAQLGLPVNPQQVVGQLEVLRTAPTIGQAQSVEAQGEGLKEVVKGRAQNAVAVESVEQIPGLSDAERKRAIASALGVDFEGPQGAEYIQLLDRLQGTEDPFERNFIIGRLNKLQRDRSGPLVQIGGVTPVVDENGNISLVSPEGGNSAQAGKPGKSPLGKLQIAGGQLDTLRGQKSVIDSGIEMVDTILAQIEQQPDRFGLTGSVQATAENVGGMASDLAKAGLSFIGLESVAKTTNELREAFRSQVADSAALEELVPATAGAVDVFESTLTYAIARSLQPDGRLLQDTITAAREQAQLRGLISSGRVTERLSAVRSLLARQSADLTARMQQGVAGSSSVKRPDISTSKKSPDEMTQEEVSEAVNRILGQ